MGQVLLVTLREGIEMFLIVAIAVAYLRKTGRAALLPAVTWGTGVAVLASVILGVWLAEVAVVPKWDALLALVAADRRAPRSGRRPPRWHRMARRVPLRSLHDHPRGHGDGIHHRIALQADRYRALCLGRRCRARLGRSAGLGMVPVRPSRRPRAVLSRHVGIPAAFRRAAPGLFIPRGDRGQPAADR